MDPEVSSVMCVLAGTMVAGLRATQAKMWDVHKRCPDCGASLPRAKHAESCELKDRL